MSGTMAIWTPLSENEKLSLPENIPPECRGPWMDFAKRLVDLHRHEDNLLNTRFQGFVLVTALLMAAVSQFREEKFLPIAVLICLTGLVLSAVAFRVLKRTARIIEWYIDILVRLDPLLYEHDSQRLYQARLTHLQELDTRKKPLLYPASALLGAWLPFLVSLVWFVMLLSFWWIHRDWLFWKRFL